MGKAESEIIELTSTAVGYHVSIDIGDDSDPVRKLKTIDNTFK